MLLLKHLALPLSGLKGSADLGIQVHHCPSFSSTKLYFVLLFSFGGTVFLDERAFTEATEIIYELGFANSKPLNSSLHRTLFDLNFLFLNSFLR
jgi:hypothetical protein